MRSDSLGSRLAPVLVAGSILVLLLGIAATFVFDLSLDEIREDPAATTGVSPLTGALTNLGILAWWTGAVVALFTSALIWQIPEVGRAPHFLLVGGLITTYLAFDDLFLIHDDLVPRSALPQPVFLGFIALVVTLYMFRFREFVATTNWRLLFVASVLFGASLAVDFVSDLGGYLDAWGTPPAEGYLEDSFKWLGIVAWSTYLVQVSSLAILPIVRRSTQQQQ